MSDNFIKAGVIGHPISHSKSPLIHGHWLETYGLHGSYEAIDIHPDNLNARLNELVNEGYSGFNLTIPHKELVLEWCDEIEHTAKKIGAVNTIAIKAGRSVGMNTDAFGFIQNLKESAPDFDIQAGAAMILGAGGAARAALYGLLEAGCPEIIIANRTRQKAEALAEEFGSSTIAVVDWARAHTAMHEIVLLSNTTALGMEGQPALNLDLGTLNPEAVVYDIVYTPLHTELLKRAQQRGNEIVTGIGMLLHQARPAFEAWFGVMPTIDEVLMGRVQS